MHPADNTRVLIVAEDKEDSRQIQELLARLDFELAGAATERQYALELIQSTQPDVVLLDSQPCLPHGIETARLILERCPTPTVLFTPQKTADLVQLAEAAGAGALLTKPVQLDDLEQAILVAQARFDDMMALRRKTAELEALHQAGLRLTHSLELQPVLDALLEHVLKLVRADDAHIFIYEEGEIIFGAALWSDGTQGQPFAPPRPDGLTYRVARGGERIVVNDLSNHPLFEGLDWTGAIVGIPLHFGEQVIGVMNVAYLESHVFEENELRLLELLAAQAAIAIHNAHLFGQVQRHATELERRVAERTQELTEANERLLGLDQLKSKFITDISHELRTPATNVRLYLQLLEQGKTEKRAGYLEVIKKQTERIVRLVEDILYFSQLELDKAKIQFAPVNLNLIAQQVVNAHRLRADAAGLELIFEPDLALPEVQAEAEQLAQVVKSLVENGINYTEAGQVRVVTRWDPSEARALLEVSDTGRGIAPQDLPHLFERFFRGQGVGSSAISGSGLGLSIAQEVVHLHGGEITVQSKVAQGSTFTVSLPVAQR